MNSMIQLTENAAKKLKSLRSEEGKDESHFLRVEVKKGGCSGLSYKMNFDHEARPGDKDFQAFGERVVVDGQSFMYLVGMTLDFFRWVERQGFCF